MVHKITKSERAHNFLKDDAIIKGFKAGTTIESVTFTTIDGTTETIDRNWRGEELHIHNTFDSRIDGLAQVYNSIHGDLIDVEMTGTKVYITELPDNTDTLTERAEAVFAKIMAAKGSE